MKRNLAIVEFKEEVEFFLRKQPVLLSAPVKVLSLLPEASAYLYDKGVNFTTSTEYFSRSSHEKTLTAVDRIIKKINKTITIKDSNHINETYVNTLTFHLRQYLSYIILNIETISNVINEEGIEQIYACRYKGNDYSKYNLLPKERILGEIVMLFKDKCDLKIGELQVNPKFLPNPQRKKIKQLVSAIYNSLELILNRNNKENKILLYSLKYNFDQIVKSFKGIQFYNLAPNQKSIRKMSERRWGMNITNLHLNELGNVKDSKFLESIETARILLEDLHKEEELFSYRGYDFSSIVFKKIKEGYFNDFLGLNKRITSLKNVLETLQPKLVISPMAREISYALGELSRNLKIPSILISHGSHVPPKNEFEKMEWKDHGKGMIDTYYEHHLLQSPWAAKYTRVLAPQKEYEKIFPLVFTKVDRTDKEKKQFRMYPRSHGKKVILHAGTPKPRGSNRLYIYETLDEYIKNMADLIEATRYLKDSFLIIRFRPSQYLSLENLKKLLPVGNHFKIATKGSFNNYLTIADLIISFSSTTIEEALINRIPVLQYDPSDRYQHIVGTSSINDSFGGIDSVYYVGSQLQLTHALEWIVQNHLKAHVADDIFDRHLFKKDDAISIDQFIDRIVNKKSVDEITEELRELIGASND